MAAGTARVFYAWCTGSPVPEAQDGRGEGVADFAARRARVSQVLMPDRWAAGFAGSGECGPILAQLTEPQETIYDGANAFTRVGGRWTGFFLGDPAGPRGLNDPLWPLDALSGARDDAVGTGPEDVRGVAVTRYRLTVDLLRADAAGPAGVSVPGGPYRALSQLPAEVWLDADGLARRIAVSTESQATGETKPTWAVVELWDFGVTADITPPRPDEVVPPREAYQEAYPDEADSES